VSKATTAPAAAGPPHKRRSFVTPLLLGVVAAFVLMVIFYGLSNTFNLLIINPLINFLVFLDIIMLGNFGMAIILFTVLLRLATTPLTISTYRSSKNMQAAQPMMQEIQKKYAKDPQRQRQELAKVYKDYGINPLGCALPFLIQIIFFGALYRALVYMVGGSPESLVGLSQRLYDIPFLQEAIPLDQDFLWMDLGQPDQTYILPVLVFVTTYVQQKMSTPANPTPQQAQQQAMMTWMMPLIITMFMLQLPSGVGLYWVVSNIIGLVTGYYVYGRSLNWRTLLPFPTQQAPAPAPVKATDGARPKKQADEPVVDIATNGEEPAAGAPEERVRVRDGKRRGKRKNRR
jgi:YidC/Oxa1 family membrane protein insertase